MQITTSALGDAVQPVIEGVHPRCQSGLLGEARLWGDHNRVGVFVCTVQCYRHDTVAQIVAELRGHDAAEAREAGEVIAARSPTALAVTLARAAKLSSLQEVLVQDYRVSSTSLRRHDLLEGIRAQLVDKDRNPKWSPADFSAITPAVVDAHFAPADPDLTF